MTCSQPLPRSSRRSPEITAPCIDMGTHKSAASPFIAPLKGGAATPITVNG